ncbi:CHAT domain-containing protein [Spirillospora sp. CA-253888]
MNLDSSHSAAQHVQKAYQHLVQREADGCDAAYRRAVEAARPFPQLRRELMADHVSALLDLGRISPARELVDAYLAEGPPDPLPLRVLRAETLSAQHDHRRAAAQAREVLAGPDRLNDQDRARLRRVLGSAFANEGLVEDALDHLHQALMTSGTLRSADAARLRDDMRTILDREGYERTRSDLPPTTVSDRLRRAEELRRDNRYQDAVIALLTIVDPDPALRWPVLRELTVLAWLLRRPDIVERLGPLLVEAADTFADPAAAHAERAHLMTSAPPAAPPSQRVDIRVMNARRLIDDGELAKAETLLIELRDHVRSPRDRAWWLLAAAESQWLRHDLSPCPATARACAEYAREAVVASRQASLTEAEIASLRLCGRALALLGTDEADNLAVKYWAEAHQWEETVASLQRDDRTRVRMLQAAPSEHDERIRTAVKRVRDGVGSTAAVIPVAMEAARGALLLHALPPDDDVRTLPRPGDEQGALDWVGRVAQALPFDQAVWLIHPTPDRVHHVLIHRTTLRHVHLDRDRNDLAEAVEEFGFCWSDPAVLETSVRKGHFDIRSARLAALLGIPEVVEQIPPRVRRLAVVAGNETADIPLAALPSPADGGPLGLRYALSDLPCVSALAPLRLRSRDRRGDAVLLVEPRPDELTSARERACDRLTGRAATPDGLRAALAERRHAIVRLDGHGRHDHTAFDASVLALSPEGPAGHLRPDDLERMDLDRCGTLVLGACESGMVQRLGRDERHGFVRAAFNAGAASVVAARWPAPDATAALLLDRFQRRLRHLPRDLALWQAIRDIHTADRDMRHPAHWACWSLYGDSDLQTSAGRLRRWLRKRLDRPPTERDPGASHP